ncbi:MAG: four-helix bundle copper-binding protein [Candidatus Melainabacteria bacterium HGW-Melainabacteria-1]|nr:MAG: four-helix bundle copper-binding protein [Candidatus Melainabacteria bacterium HGW-Melainabacteria-1]
MIAETAQSCIDACLVTLHDSERCLEDCVSHLSEGQQQPDFEECLRACRDVISIVGLCASMLLRDDEFSVEACRLCAQICWRAAVLCGTQSDKFFYLRCAESSQICAELCEQFVFYSQWQHTRAA